MLFCSDDANAMISFYRLNLFRIVSSAEFFGFVLVAKEISRNLHVSTETHGCAAVVGIIPFLAEGGVSICVVARRRGLFSRFSSD